jgi:uncharacterized protein RhaS with RHS repeats
VAVTFFASGVDGSGNLVSMTTPELCTTSLVYDGSNRLSAYVEPAGSRTSYAYDDDLDWVKSVQRPDGAITTVAWNDWDSTTITGPKGDISTILYTVGRNVRAFENPLGQRATMAWENNELQSVMDALGRTTTLIWTEAANRSRRLEAIVNALGQRSTYVFDSNSLTEALVDPMGSRTSLVWSGPEKVTATKFG